jgi:hypothetical protein
MDNLPKLSKFEKVGEGYKLSLNFDFVTNRIKKAQMALDTQVWLDVQKYMPIDTGNFIQETNAINMAIAGKGRVYLYPPNDPRGHYLYEGKLYVDPVYGKGAFYSPTYGFWSRPNIKKVKTEKDLTYSNPNAISRWGEVAYSNHHQDWVEVVRKALEE